MELVREINDDYEIKDKSDTEKYLSEFKNEDREYLIVLGLDTRNKVLYREIVAIGTMDGCMIHPREVFKKAVMSSCNSLIVAHNHPSNSVEPSEEDIEIHKKLIKAGEILNIKVIDCIIITADELRSFIDEVK